MSLPIDEMLSNLRAVLDAFGNVPTFDNLVDVSREILIIQRKCEDALFASLERE